MAKKTSAEASADKPVEKTAGAEAKETRKPKSAKPDVPAGTDAAPAPAATPRPSAPSESQSKKKRRPGSPPSRGKKLRERVRQQFQKLKKEGPIPLPRAIGLLKQLKRSKFDETVEIHMSLGVDATQSDQLVRGTVPLPHGIGKAVRVVVFCQGENVAKAKEAGADFAGGDELLEKVQKEGWLDFDVALATQDMMGKVSRLGKILGPRGLMPTPKAGTVITGDVAGPVRDFKAGKVEYRTDKGGNVHAGVGKISFDDAKLVENVTTFVEAIRGAKPSGVKGHYVRSINICSTMSPGIPVAM